MNSKKQRSSGHTIRILAQAVPLPLLTLCHAQNLFKGTVGFSNMVMEKSRLYGIGNLM